MLRSGQMLILLLVFILSLAAHQPRDDAIIMEPAQAGRDQRAAPGTIQVRVRLVPVDVTVTDRNDRPVTDLKKEEFRIFENGREQEVRHFSIQTFSATATAHPAQAPLQQSNPPEITPQTARTFLILMGRGRHYRFKNMENLIRWLRTGLLPGDRVGVFAYNRASNMTTDHEVAVRVVEAYQAVHEKIESELESRASGLSAIYGSKTIPGSVQAHIDRIFAASGPLDSRQVPADISDNAQARRDQAKAGQILTHQIAKQGADTVADPGQSIAATANELAAMDMATGMIPLNEWAALNTGSTQDMKNIFTCIEYLRYLEGEKHLLFFTEDGLFFPFGNVDNDETIAQVANNARVAIDTFQTGGIKMDMGIGRGPVNLAVNRLSNPGRGDALTSLRTISELTGGRTSIYGNLGPALARVDAISRVQYLLAYYPKDENWDGDYRRIDVRVTRPGLKVSYRHGYFARDLFRPADAEEYLIYSRVTAAGGYEAEIGDIPFKIETGISAAGSGQKQIDVTLNIDISAVGFRTVNGRHTGRLRVVVYYADGRRNYLGEDWKNVDLKLLEDTYRQFLQSGLPVTIAIPMRQPSQILKVVIYDTGSDRVGSKLVKVRAPGK